MKKPNPSRLFTAVASLSLIGFAIVQAQTPGQQIDPAVQKAYGDGLQFWREPDITNSSCSFCHSPDAIELAAYNFDDDNILRRAKPHFPDQAPKALEFIRTVRKKYGITKLLDPLKDRPLQPGGQILTGDTPEARDAAFGRSLATVLPSLTAQTVDSPEKARKAKDELLKVDPWKLPIGIPFNRISEDGFHGKEHATLAHWIADTAVIMHFPWSFFYVTQDQYLADPSDANFLAMLGFAKETQSKYTYAQQMANNKYRALLVYQHLLRMQALGKPSFENAGPVLLGNLRKKELANPLFELGVLTDERADSRFSDFHFPNDVLTKKNGGPAEAAQLKQIRLPSLWAGWMMDQGLQRIEVIPADRATSVITERLMTDGPYPMHDAFLIARKQAVEGFVPIAWNSPAPQHFVLDYSGFLANGNFKRYEPADAPARETYRKFVANTFRMTMYLALDELQSQKTKYPNEPMMEQLPVMQAYLHEVEPGQAAAVDGLVAQIHSAYGSAVPYAAKGS